MQSKEKILLLQNHQIDKAKWDESILAACNSLIYGHSFYLDAMSPAWMALVAEDYSWVLPLTTRKKFGISYLYQPAFMQQAGVFSKQNVSIPWKNIFEQMQKHFKFCEMFWNYSTDIHSFPPSLSTKVQTNFVLGLQNSYEDISELYHTDLVKNLKRAEKHTLHFCEEKDYKKAIELYKKQYGQRFQHVSENDYKQFSNVCQMALEKKMLTVFEMRNDNDECLSIALLLKDGKRLYNIMNTTTEAGRKVKANHLLFDHIIRLHAASNYIFDFEGSDLPGVKSFYENFGAEDQPYFFIKYNKLPLLLKLFKQ